jgi:hypothetical protein
MGEFREIIDNEFNQGEQDKLDAIWAAGVAANDPEFMASLKEAGEGPGLTLPEFIDDLPEDKN